MSIQKAEKYLNGVISGEIVSCEYIRLAVERHFNDLDHMVEKGWYFDKKAVELCFGFFSLVKHAPDKRNWVSFECEPWQAAEVYILFGWKKADGSRRFNLSYTEIAKKNGKTTFAALIALYLLFADGENEAEIYCAAYVEKQSMICFQKIKQMIEKTPVLKKYTTLLKKNISIQSTWSKIEPLGRDSDSIEGINPHGSIIDEYHVWKNNDVMDNITSATVNRFSPLTFIITTAGKDKTLPCFEFRQMCIDVLRGIKKQDDLFVFIFSLDENDDWKDQRNWIKVNPNLGVSVRLDKLQSEFQRALNSPTQEYNFRTKNMNQWVDAPKTWIKDELVVKCSRPDNDITEQDLLASKCYAGVDLAAWVDLNAFALYWENVKGRRAAKFFFWIPEAKVEEKGDRVDYRVWRDMGLIKVTAGNVIDIDEIVLDMTEIINKYNPESIDYDPAKAYNGVIQGLAKTIDSSKLHEYSQSIKYMTQPTRELERVVSAGTIEFFGNPVIRWMFRNAFAIKDQNDNIKLDKNRSIEKIDGLIALLNAMGRCHFSENEDDYIITDVTECETL